MQNQHLTRGLQCLYLSAYIVISACATQTFQHDERPNSPGIQANNQNPISESYQLTFTGKRSGEAYFDTKSERLIFQAEHLADNPFYQMYTMNIDSGKATLLSDGTGKTTCGYFHPQKNLALYASTHLDPEKESKQKDEIISRAHGKKKRYAWDFDLHFDIFAKDLASNQLTQLTKAKGYDAEGAYSPDGNWIVFGSNRHAYTGSLNEEDKATLSKNSAHFMEIYTMRHDGSEVQRLTHEAGYDGGPFFSPDGQRIVWRHFDSSGHQAEIWTMKTDGTDKKQITDLKAMSWAPFYHPSGEYIIFTTNLHGYKNFELYIVDTEGTKTPKRITDNDYFDGLPVFAPRGDLLNWTATNTQENTSQIFIAKWDHQKALQLLGLPSEELDAEPVASPPTKDKQFQALKRHVDNLCAPEMAGRKTGTPGEALATDYVAKLFKAHGLEPLEGNKGYFETFEFRAGTSVGMQTHLKFAIGNEASELEQEKEWAPLEFSENGSIDVDSFIFGGYGIVAPEQKLKGFSYDSFPENKTLKDKWVIVMRDMPQNLSDAERQHLLPFSSLRAKAITARDFGAKGIIFVTGPLSPFKKDVISLKQSRGHSQGGIQALMLGREQAAKLFRAAGKDLNEIQSILDKGQKTENFILKNFSFSGHIALERETRQGRNVIGKISGSSPNRKTVIIGAHVDHLGEGSHSSSLSRNLDADPIHHGADDNASGTAIMLALAEAFSQKKKDNPESIKNDIVFAAWSGEEIGILGSQHFVNQWTDKSDSRRLKNGQTVLAYVNMDMVGRLRENLILQGIGSSPFWKPLIQEANSKNKLPIRLNSDPYLPTDATSFYLKGIPVINAFTGAHSDYHSPGDTPDKINYTGLNRIANLLKTVVDHLSQTNEIPHYVAKKAKKRKSGRGLRLYIGTVPDYAAAKVKGLKISGTSAESPAAKAGLEKGDIIIELAGKQINDIYDYMHALNALKPNKTVKIRVLRNKQKKELSITPQLRE